MAYTVEFSSGADREFRKLTRGIQLARQTPAASIGAIALLVERHVRFSFSLTS